jgi:hypothetical protein
MQLFSFAKSAGIKIHSLLNFFLMVLAVNSASFSSLFKKRMATFAPCCANATATALPIPLSPPVMTQFLPSNFFPGLVSSKKQAAAAFYIQPPACVVTVFGRRAS